MFLVDLLIAIGSMLLQIIKGLLSPSNVKMFGLALACGLFQSIFFAVVYKYNEHALEDKELKFIEVTENSMKGIKQDLKNWNLKSTIMIHQVQSYLVAFSCIAFLTLGFTYLIQKTIEIKMSFVLLTIIGLILILVSIVKNIVTNATIDYYLSTRFSYKIMYDKYWNLMLNVLASVFFTSIMKTVAFAGIELNFLGSIACGYIVVKVYQVGNPLKQKHLKLEKEILNTYIKLHIAPNLTLEPNYDLTYNDIPVDLEVDKIVKLSNKFNKLAYITNLKKINYSIKIPKSETNICSRFLNCFKSLLS